MGNDCETDCLRTTDATRKEENDGGLKYDAIAKRDNSGEANL